MASVGRKNMSDAMIPITERFLSEAGGWQALKEARGMQASGRVLAANYAPPLLEGRVREGEGELRTGLRIISASKVENLCGCRVARRDGMICAHALAVGLEWLKPRALPVPVAPAEKEAGPLFGTEEGEVMELHVVLPGNFAAAWERGHITVGAEAALPGRRALVSVLDPARRYRCPDADLPILEKLRELAGGELPGVVTLDRTAFLDLLPTLAGHPRTTFAKTTPAIIHATAFRPNPDLPPKVPLLATGACVWLLDGAAFHPLALEPAPAAPTAAEIAPPCFALALEGSLNHLTARLDAVYDAGGHTFTVEAAPRSTAFARHHAAERGALERLRQPGFTGPDRSGQLVLKGEPAILGFFARDLPKLEKEWSVTIGERFTYVTRDIERIQPRFEIRTSGENWFDLQIELTTASGDRYSAGEIQRLLQSGQNTTRGKNGKRAVFDASLINEFQESLTDCNPQQKQPGLYRIARCHAPFLGEVALEQGVAVESDAAWRDWSRMTESQARPPVEDLGALAEVLRPYQKEGVSWLKNLNIHGASGLLADEMGLGKTVQTLAFLRGVRGKALVICPSSLVFNWQREAQRFTPDLQVLTIQGADRHTLFAERMKKADLVITSYALLRRDIERYHAMEFAVVVLDEAQHIKNPDSQNAQSSFSLKAGFRLALTGTPLENSLTDIWSLMNFLMPGYLGSRKEFRERFENEIVRDPKGAVHRRLIKRMKPFILRRLKRNVAKELPDKIEQIAYCELTKEQSAVYTALTTNTRRMMSEWSAEKDQGKVRMLMLTALLRLRQASCDLRLLKLKEDADLREPSGKMQLLEEILLEAIDGGHRVLLFSQFTSMLGIIRQTLTDSKISFCYLDGQTKDRHLEVDRFQAGTASVFLISLKAGGAGLNLTAADTVIHFDPWWNPAVENQATDRAHRIGQTNVVTSYKLIARGTVEEKILALQQRKRDVIDATLDHEQPLLEGLNDHDLLDLLA